MSNEVKPHLGTLFMPTLLDRLNSGVVGKKGKNHQDRNAYRQSVLRDLQWLLNCANLESQLALQPMDYAKSSVLNFGVPSYAGSRFIQSDLIEVANSIKHSIIKYEPRIIAKTLDVQIIKNSDGNNLCKDPLFRIEALLWFEPHPIELVIRALWDSESGSIKLYDN